MIRFPLFKQQKGRMPMDTHESDCVIVYEETADLFDQRRASRIRFAAANLPILLGVWVLAWILFWLYNQASISGKTASGLQIGSAMTVFVLAIYRLLHYQNLWLERRCNDAGKAWDTAEYVKKGKLLFGNRWHGAARIRFTDCFRRPVSIHFRYASARQSQAQYQWCATTGYTRFMFCCSAFLRSRVCHADMDFSLNKKLYCRMAASSLMPF